MGDVWGVYVLYTCLIRVSKLALTLRGHSGAFGKNSDPVGTRMPTLWSAPRPASPRLDSTN